MIVGTWQAAQPHDARIPEAEIRDALHQLDPLWAEFFPAEQARLVQLLVEKVTIHDGALDIRFRSDGLPGLVHDVLGRAAA